jgi:hypothetical protein
MAKPDTASASTLGALSAPDDADHCLTRAQVAERLQISQRHVAHLEAWYFVPVLRVGRAIRYDAQAWNFLIDAMRSPPGRVRAGRFLRDSPAARPNAPTTSALEYLTSRLGKLKAGERTAKQRPSVRGQDQNVK